MRVLIMSKNNMTMTEYTGVSSIVVNNGTNILTITYGNNQQANFNRNDYKAFILES